MAEFVMPQLGADMRAGTLVEWRKAPGDVVQRGDIIAEVESDKGDIEVEVFTGGVIDRLLASPGDRVPTGTALAIIRTDEAAPPQHAAPPPADEPHGRLLISPAARQLAQELGVDPAGVHGTGPGGRITRADVAAAAPAPTAPSPAPPAQVAEDRSLRMRRAIAAAMTRSNREIPHYYLTATIDMHRATEWLEQRNCELPVPERLLSGVLLLKAVALALRDFPELNGVWRDDRVEPRADIHLGVAISLRGGGLVAPALSNADTRPLDELMAAFRDLVSRARAGSLRSSELSDSTITVTSLGERGVEQVLGVIFPPQVAIVGFGALLERPWVVDGQVVPRPVIIASLAGDHRASDGHRGAAFLAALDRLLQAPEKL